MRKLLAALVFVAAAAAVCRAQNLIPYQKGAKWGYADASGNVVVEAKYAAVSRFADGYGVVYDYRTGLAGLVDASGRMVIEPKFTYIDLCNEGIVAVYRYNGKNKDKKWTDGVWSYIDLSKPDSLFFGNSGYDMVGPFVDGVAWINGVATNSKRMQRYMPIMDKKGKKEIGRDYLLGVTESFRMVDLFARDDNGNYIVFDGKWALIDRHGNLLTDTSRPYDMVGEFKDGLAWVRRGGLYGFVNTRGEEVIPVAYKAVEGVPGAPVTSLVLHPESGAVRWVMDGSGRIAWLDEKGETVIDFIKSDGRIPVSSFVNESMWDY
ncbi:MAG TPA: WG repeat-containing protein [Candidatus Coprenecus stercoravium]|uniref:WG repeat-containing protein n=1 Tax=Candidatus Coprenecus stercoravium TaxID=2840735 RepID=A0A9D2GP49_9BACT|nr:WG repeat-containing protein [Candidatus Coprenecus stercoravium]